MTVPAAGNSVPEGRSPSALPALALVFTLLFSLILAGCASAPPPPPWPPPPGQPAAHIFIYADHYHSIIGLPSPPKGTEEWAFGERIWFYDEKDTPARLTWYFVLDAFRALLWPHPGVVEVSQADKPYNVRNAPTATVGPATSGSTKVSPTRIGTWELTVSPEGLARMRAYLESSIGEKKAIFDDGWQVYYSASRRYHVFYTCHHYVAGALRAAGVPVHSSFCFLPAGLWWQLDRLAAEKPGKP